MENTTCELETFIHTVLPNDKKAPFYIGYSESSNRIYFDLVTKRLLIWSYKNEDRAERTCTELNKLAFQKEWGKLEARLQGHSIWKWDLVKVLSYCIRDHGTD